MFRKLVLVSLSFLMLALGMLGCNSTAPTSAPGAAQPTSAPAAAKPTQAAAVGGQAMYACSIFSPAEAESLLGKPVAGVPWQPAPGTEAIMASCIYQVQDAPSQRTQLDVVRYPGKNEARRGFEENKTMMITVFKAETKTVTGLGEEAMWINNPPERSLAARQDNLVLSVKNVVQVQDAKMEQLVKQMLGHLQDLAKVPPPIVTTTQQQPTSAPATKPAAQPTAQPTRTASPTPASNTTSTAFDGEWKGKISNDTRFAFTVAKNEISRVNMDFAIPAGVCKGFGGTLILTVKNAPIQDNSFTAQVQDKDSKLEFKGTFQSSTQASGTLHLTGKSNFCGEYELDAKWSASK